MNTIFAAPTFGMRSDSAAADCEQMVDGLVVAASINEIAPEKAIEGNS